MKKLTNDEIHQISGALGHSIGYLSVGVGNALGVIFSAPVAIAVTGASLYAGQSFVESAKLGLAAGSFTVGVGTCYGVYQWCADTAHPRCL